MQVALIEGLGMGDNDAAQRASTFLSEEADITMEREALLQRKRRLEEIKERLFRFHI